MKPVTHTAEKPLDEEDVNIAFENKKNKEHTKTCLKAVCYLHFKYVSVCVFLPVVKLV